VPGGPGMVSIAADADSASRLMSSKPEERGRSLRHLFGRVAAIMFGQGEEHPCWQKTTRMAACGYSSTASKSPMTSHCCLRLTNQLEAVVTGGLGPGKGRGR
jgi:hypothetical protein